MMIGTDFRMARSYVRRDLLHLGPELLEHLALHEEVHVLWRGPGVDSCLDVVSQSSAGIVAGQLLHVQDFKLQTVVPHGDLADHPDHVLQAGSPGKPAWPASTKAAHETVPSSSVIGEDGRPAGLLGLHDLAADADLLVYVFVDHPLDFVRGQVLLDFDDLKLPVTLWGIRSKLPLGLMELIFTMHIFARARTAGGRCWSG